MPDFLLEDFRRGVDLRRAPFAAPQGALYKGVNVHITAGGDIEVRKAFVKIATLPAGCFGLAAFASSLYTFGSVSAPAMMPSGFAYQRLQHPTGLAMTRIVDIETYDGKAFVIGEFTAGDTRVYYNATRLKDWDPDVSLFRFSVTSGTAAAGNKVSSITVNAVEVLGADVLWTTSHENTAALIAAQINSFASTPEYSAYVPKGTAEVVISSAPGALPTGSAVAITVAGNLIVTPASGAMAAPLATPTSALTAGEKIYVTSGANMVFCATGDPTNFSPNSIGGGFINVSTQSSGADTLLGAELFYEGILIFAKDSAQRWSVFSDDALNSRSQTFRGVGLLSSRAALSYLDGPSFFLDRRGVRAIQTQTLTGRSFARPDSKPIDKDLTAAIAALAPSQRARALMLTEPEEDRIWAVVGATIFVRTWFQGDQAPSWTTYEPGFVIDHYAILDGRLYVMSGQDVYLYGGTTGDEYEACAVTVRLPYANAHAPATYKDLMGLDLGIEGEWTVLMSEDPGDTTFTDAVQIGIFNDQTYDQPTIPIASHTPQVSLEFRHSKAEYARISNVMFHYKTDETG